MTGASAGKEKPVGAWSAQETVLYMVRIPNQLHYLSRDLMRLVHLP